MESGKAICWLRNSLWNYSPVCHIFCFAKTKEVVEVPVAQKNPLRLQTGGRCEEQTYLLALLGQVLFGFILYGGTLIYSIILPMWRMMLYCSPIIPMAIIIPSIIGAACSEGISIDFQQGLGSSVVCLWYRYHHNCNLFFFSPVTSPYLSIYLRYFSQFFFSVSTLQSMQLFRLCGIWRMAYRYPEWWFPICFHFSGNKIGMALGTALLALSLGQCIWS